MQAFDLASSPSKGLKKTKSMPWDSSTWDPLAELKSEFETLKLQKQSGDGKQIIDEPPFIDRWTSEYHPKPPPGFHSYGEKNVYSVDDADTDTDTDTEVGPWEPPKRRKNSALKRCVTFAGAMISKNPASGDLLPAASGQGVDFSEPRSLRRIDSARLVRQAFPKTIFDNSDSTCDISPGATHARTKSENSYNLLSYASSALPGFSQNGGQKEGLKGNRQKLKRTESASSVVSTGSTASTSTTGSNPVVITHEKQFNMLNTPMDPAKARMESNSAKAVEPTPEKVTVPVSLPTMNGHDRQFVNNAQSMNPFPSESGAGNYFPQGYQNVGNPMMPMPNPMMIPPGQQQQIQLMQQALHNQMMYTWMMQQSMMQQQQQMSPRQPMPSQPHPRYSQYDYPPGSSGPNGTHTMNGSSNWQHRSFGKANARSSPKNRRRHEGALLTQHKTSGYRPELSELLGHIVEFSRDPHGSRYVQFMMEAVSKQDRQLLINEILDDAVDLMQDLFGNYVMQNFLENSDQKQTIQITNRIRGSMTLLSMQPHGCRVVQRAIDMIPTENRNELLNELLESHSKILRCAKDPHATHVLQKAVILLQAEIKRDHLAKDNLVLLSKIENSVAMEFLQLAVHPHACRLVQRTLGDCIPKRSQAINNMLEMVVKNYAPLSVDQHGNFILQHILDHGSKLQAGSVQDFVCLELLELAQHKFGSHLVEKSLQCATEKQANAMVSKLLGTNSNENESKSVENDQDGEDMLLVLMKDPYANFVVQRAFDASTGELRLRFADEIKSRSEILSRFTYGRHILLHINKD
mmetsp:Transcript_11764/g.14278  ORF Transcript_11764/g.14278 Transcript_11764/m.14278 type:complete len:803 (-) Transcript_11764:835-3243(-)|eukprot:CAMPEP_0184023454 /NCGR_PEP_ID=MMETSP0954-20121128/11376_1 /TAXON_ID=627963 /ORGANISM="Aplanochytrium sp, Strain PBS07" /LENGTH=802 /DNA_ID=CAMNT_0026306353 /DNA_START=287 /DNA_END=2695 /DNA_ORIENTATION=+